MLYIIGIGLDKQDLTLKAMQAIKKCRKVYLETYTSHAYKISELEKIIGKKVIAIGRETVENNADSFLKEAKKQNIAFLVFGDALAATTHIGLLLRAKKLKIKTEVIHGISIFNAVSQTGLQIYKFGKTASIPRWQKSFKPESFYDLIKENLAIKAHTLLLLDIGLEVNEALGYIKEISEKRNDNLESWHFIICSRLGTSRQQIRAGKLQELMKEKFSLPACIIIPATLHFMEAEMLGIKHEEKS